MRPVLILMILSTFLAVAACSSGPQQADDENVFEKSS